LETYEQPSGVSVVDGSVPPRGESGWSARYRVGPGDWAECRLVDISLTGARVQIFGPAPVGLLGERAFFLQIDSIAEDDVGITMKASIQQVEQDVDGRRIAHIEFSARREEQLLLHLLVRLHELV
jgi:hypothetical protein